jgi:hypothetical protein
MERADARHRRQNREGSGERAGTRPSFKGISEIESKAARVAASAAGAVRVSSRHQNLRNRRMITTDDTDYTDDWEVSKDDRINRMRSIEKDLWFILSETSWPPYFCGKPNRWLRVARACSRELSTRREGHWAHRCGPRRRRRNTFGRCGGRRRFSEASSDCAYRSGVWPATENPETSLPRVDGASQHLHDAMH